MKKCELDPESECTAEKTSECICIACINANRGNFLQDLLNLLQRVSMPFAIANAIGHILMLDALGYKMTNEWMKRYHPEYYAEMKKRWEVQQEKMKAFLDKARGKELGYRA